MEGKREKRKRWLATGLLAACTLYLLAALVIDRQMHSRMLARMPQVTATVYHAESYTRTGPGRGTLWYVRYEWQGREYTDVIGTADDLGFSHTRVRRDEPATWFETQLLLREDDPARAWYFVKPYGIVAPMIISMGMLLFCGLAAIEGFGLELIPADKKSAVWAAAAVFGGGLILITLAWSLKGEPFYYYLRER